MLAVAVLAHDEIVAVLQGVQESGLHRRADPEVAGVPQDRRAGLARQRPGLVLRSVVDHGDVAGEVLAHREDDPRDRRGLVECRDDQQGTHGRGA